MTAAPAVDLKGGRCVQLVGGRPRDERVSLPDPAAVARRWWDAGFETLHVVDLDAALGSGENRRTVMDVLEATPAITQVGGGIRDRHVAEEVLAGGAARIVVGTRAVDDRPWLEALATRHAGRVMVAADIRNGLVLRRGWTEASALPVEEFVASLEGLPLAGVLCTDVSREGRLQGIDARAMAAVVGAAHHPVWISGGITGLDDLGALDDAGAAGAVLGMALYTARIDPEEVARLYGRADDGPAPDPGQAGSGPHPSDDSSGPRP